jgi:hypothetical protein
MRQLGEGVQSEERQMLLPFLRHLSLRPAAARLADVPINPATTITIASFFNDTPKTHKNLP